MRNEFNPFIFSLHAVQPQTYRHTCAIKVESVNRKKVSVKLIALVAAFKVNLRFEVEAREQPIGSVAPVGDLYTDTDTDTGSTCYFSYNYFFILERAISLQKALVSRLIILLISST